MENKNMKQQTRYLAYGAIIAALYLVLTHLQNFLLPGTATMAVQFRLSEALCVLALFTPAAIPGLALGCLLFNLTSGAALPLDWFVGTTATILAALTMAQLKKVTLRKIPVAALLMPAVFNALLVGAELTVYRSAPSGSTLFALPPENWRCCSAWGHSSIFPFSLSGSGSSVPNSPMLRQRMDPFPLRFRSGQRSILCFFCFIPQCKGTAKGRRGGIGALLHKASFFPKKHIIALDI